MKRKKDMDVEEIFLLDESATTTLRKVTTATTPTGKSVTVNTEDYGDSCGGGWSSATSSYFSCSESTSNLANSNSYEEEEEEEEESGLTESDDDTTTSSLGFTFTGQQVDLIRAVCHEIDLKYQARTMDVKLSRQFWSYLLNKLDLIGLLNGHKIDSFWVNLDRLLACLTRVQDELNLQPNEHTLVNLALVLYEWEGQEEVMEGELEPTGRQAGRPACLCTICRDGGGQTDELAVNLLKPRYTSERVEFASSNPITQSYKSLVSNLTKLNLYSTDPTHANDDDGDDGEDNARINDYNNNTSSQTMGGKASPNGAGSFGTLLASYYTMGYFDVRKCLFDNTYQHLHERRAFAAEMNALFRNDLRLGDYEQGETNAHRTRGHVHKRGLSDSKQSFSRWPNVFESSESRSSPGETKSEPSLYEDILGRIESLNQTNLFESYFKILKDASATSSLEKPPATSAPTGRNWTVAPKLFSTNTTHNCSGKRLHSLNGNCPTSNDTNSNIPPSSLSSSTFLSKNFLNEKSTWSQGSVKTPSGTDARPIGTKPASMFSTLGSHPNSSRYRNTQNKYVYVNPNLVKSSSVSSTTKHQQTVQVSNIWTRNGVTNGVSPFVAYESTHGFNLNEPIDLKKCATIYHPNNTPPARSGTGLPPALKPAPIEIKTKKYSVAPLGLVTASNKKPSTNYRNYPFQQHQPQSPIVYNRQNSSPVKRTIVSYPLTIDYEAKNSSSSSSSIFRNQYHHQPAYNNQPPIVYGSGGATNSSNRTRNAFHLNRR